MKKIRDKIAAWRSSFADDRAKSAQKTLLEELFNDLYADRRKIYKVNFFRGIFFGLGSVIGGTIILAFLVWIISLFVNLPVIGDFFQETQNTLQQESPEQN